MMIFTMIVRLDKGSLETELPDMLRNAAERIQEHGWYPEALYAGQGNVVGSIDYAEE